MKCPNCKGENDNKAMICKYCNLYLMNDIPKKNKKRGRRKKKQEKQLSSKIKKEVKIVKGKKNNYGVRDNIFLVVIIAFSILLSTYLIVKLISSYYL